MYVVLVESAKVGGDFHSECPQDNSKSCGRILPTFLRGADVTSTS